MPAPAHVTIRKFHSRPSTSYSLHLLMPTAYGKRDSMIRWPPKMCSRPPCPYTLCKLLQATHRLKQGPAACSICSSSCYASKVCQSAMELYGMPCSATGSRTREKDHNSSWPTSSTTGPFGGFSSGVIMPRAGMMPTRPASSESQWHFPAATTSQHASPVWTWLYQQPAAWWPWRRRWSAGSRSRPRSAS